MVELISEYLTISSLHNEDFFALIMYLLAIKRLPNQNTSYPHFQEDAEKANLYNMVLHFHMNNNFAKSI